ncbi:MAG: hypothetical protein R3F05_18990 [Planctomycetota bacterium]|nr:hypothetical protein [Planctomycetota bacterium]
MRRLPLTLALAIGLALSACGGDPDRPVAGPARPRPELPRVSEDAIAEQALDHLLRGPGADLLSMGMPRDDQGRPIGVAGIWDAKVHGQSAEIARQDLLAVPGAMLRALAKPGLAKRLTDVHPNNEGPWLSVLRLLTSVPGLTYDDILPWIQPVVEGRKGRYVRAAALRLLAACEDDRARAELRAQLIEAAPSPDLLATVVNPLLHGEARGRADALQAVLRHGEGASWLAVLPALMDGLPPDQLESERTDALAWWAALAEGTGPTIAAARPRVKRCVPGALGVQLDARTLPAAAGRAFGLHAAPKDGWVRTPNTRDVVQPLMAFLFSGDEPASTSRCVLARGGHWAWTAAVERDMGLGDVDPMRAQRASSCVLVGLGDEARDAAISALEAWGANPSASTDLEGLARALAALPSCDLDEAPHQLVLRLVESLPADDLSMALAKRLQDLLGPSDDALVHTLVQMLVSADDGRQRLARTLMLRRPDARYVPAIEKHLASLPPEDAEAVWLRALSLVAQAPDLPAATTKRWIDQLADRVASGSDEEAARLAGALLDFGDMGIEQYADGLRGPHRLRYLSGWPAGIQPVPLAVADALVDSIDATTPPAEVYAALMVAWRTFPPTAAPALAALASRLDGRLKEDVKPVLERVRHRAAR